MGECAFPHAVSDLHVHSFCWWPLNIVDRLNHLNIPQYSWSTLFWAIMVEWENCFLVLIVLEIWIFLVYANVHFHCLFYKMFYKWDFWSFLNCHLCSLSCKREQHLQNRTEKLKEKCMKGFGIMQILDSIFLKRTSESSKISVGRSKISLYQG